MSVSRLAWTGIGAGLVLAAPPDELVFGPEPGTELERRWSEALELEVDSLEETLGGSPIDLPYDRIEFVERRSFALGDLLAECAGGRPVDLTRSFAESSMGLELTLDDQAMGSLEGAHACDGSAVRFVHEPDEQRYARTRVEGEIDAERMEGLEPDLDLLGLLPAGALEDGATFEPDLEALRPFFRAGGALGFRPARIHLRSSEVPVELMIAGALGSLHELFTPEGELTGKVEGRRAAGDEEEPELVRLEYELELELETELGERFRSFFHEASETSHDLRIGAELEGRLVLLWDGAARHLRSARFEGELTLTGHLVFPMRRAEGQEPLEFVGDYELSGTAKVALEVD